MEKFLDVSVKAPNILMYGIYVNVVGNKIFFKNKTKCGYVHCQELYTAEIESSFKNCFEKYIDILNKINKGKFHIIYLSMPALCIN